MLERSRPGCGARSNWKKISGTPERPRLVVSKSAKHIYAQVDDVVSRRIAGFGLTMEAAVRAAEGDKMSARAKQVGEQLAARAQAVGVERVVLLPTGPGAQVPRSDCRAG